MNPKWEYRVVGAAELAGGQESDCHAPEKIEKGLNERGANGWQLVCVTPTGNYILKRQDTGDVMALP